MFIERLWGFPSKNTFSIKPIAELLNQEVNDGLWIDPFANNSKLATITNDLNEEFDTDYHMDALDFLKMFGDGSVDGVLYDPPYSTRQISEVYKGVGLPVTKETTQSTFWTKQKEEVARILKPGGKAISFGWNSCGIGKKHNFEIVRILLVSHGGHHNDTIVTVEVKKEAENDTEV
ncbi:adenine-specific DNA methylase [Streptococcus suis]|uniref:adenine-specific DNA methylase n=1 Tax=Streptococcus suis TaxID=1307 RepID=UPI001F06A29F|nr:adenine-specific DNA methylase [Streptococcus suis]MCH1645065.1 adenine-specific DNA methylase [Streptococcus suis]